MASKNHRVASTVLYSGVSPASGKRFGKHAAIDALRERAQDVAGDRRAPVGNA